MLLLRRGFKPNEDAPPAAYNTALGGHTPATPVSRRLRVYDSAAPGHLKGAPNIPLQLRITYWLSGSLRILSVMVASRVFV